MNRQWSNGEFVCTGGVSCKNTAVFSVWRINLIFYTGFICWTADHEITRLPVEIRLGLGYVSEKEEGRVWEYSKAGKTMKDSPRTSHVASWYEINRRGESGGDPHAKKKKKNVKKRKRDVHSQQVDNWLPPL